MIVKPVVVDQAEWFFATEQRDIAAPTFYGVYSTEPKYANEGVAYFVKRPDADAFAKG